MPSDNVLAAIFSLGEWHNYHHVFPGDYTVAELGSPRMTQLQSQYPQSQYPRSFDRFLCLARFGLRPENFTGKDCPQPCSPDGRWISSFYLFKILQTTSRDKISEMTNQFQCFKNTKIIPEYMCRSRKLLNQRTILVAVLDFKMTVIAFQPVTC